MDPCRLCGNPHLSLLLDLGEHPIAHRLLEKRDQQEYTHSVRLSYCENCGFVQLDDPIPPENLYTRYNWLSSWKWNPHVTRQVELIGELFPELDEESNILEVGCNDGSFLEELQKRGYKNLRGVEPTHDGQQAAVEKGFSVKNAYYSERSARTIVNEAGKCDLFISRQMLEHVADLRDFQAAARTVLNPGSCVLIEVPDFDFILRELEYCAIWEEHVNYFTMDTLTRYLNDIGIEIVHAETAVFSGVARFVLGKFTGGPFPVKQEIGLTGAGAEIKAFGTRWPRFKNTFTKFLDEHQRQGGRIGIYGGGCRGCSLINFSGAGPFLEYCFDDQREKQGKFLPGSRIPIVTGDMLGQKVVDLCLLAVNAENEAKVMANHEQFIRNGGRFFSILPPSDLLPPFWKELCGKGDDFYLRMP